MIRDGQSFDTRRATWCPVLVHGAGGMRGGAPAREHDCHRGVGGDVDSAHGDGPVVDGHPVHLGGRDGGVGSGVGCGRGRRDVLLGVAGGVQCRVDLLLISGVVGEYDALLPVNVGEGDGVGEAARVRGHGGEPAVPEAGVGGEQPVGPGLRPQGRGGSVPVVDRLGDDASRAVLLRVQRDIARERRHERRSGDDRLVREVDQGVGDIGGRLIADDLRGFRVAVVVVVPLVDARQGRPRRCGTRRTGCPSPTASGPGGWSPSPRSPRPVCRRRRRPR